MRNLPLAKVYQKLEPGPVVLLTTARVGRGGRTHKVPAINVMTMSWHMMVEFEPPLIACVVADGDYSHAALRKTGECVIAIPGADLAEKVVGIGNCSGREVDKFARFGLTARPASSVAAPLIAECGVNIECRVVDKKLATRYNLFVLEAVKAWIDPALAQEKTLHHCGFGRFVLDGEVLQLASAKPDDSDQAKEMLGG